ncbi:single-stranded-DNA-specific exonuclease RecJ [Candidatus Microgenomates bacterium]|nr:single-stranded-DNA-specific exonuclease RecJ [Candidatus Microgenomates bacterium]
MSLQTKREWIFPKKKEDDILKHILQSRNIENESKFLEPNISDIPSYKKLFDTKKAAKEIIKSIELKEKIIIHGDYDADGICASSIIWEFLYKDLSKFLNTKIDVLPYIPNRIEQGYGLTEDSLNDVIDLGGKLLISVDCGVRDKELIKRYRDEKGLKFVITDHHQPPELLLENLDYPLVHQMYPEKEYPQREICGSAVVFLLVQAIKDIVGMDSNITEDTKGLDLVALATITDLMPLVDVNRIFVKYGLQQMRKGRRKGLRELALRAGIDLKDISSYHIGYILGPRINAAGRIGSPMDAVRLLVGSNDTQCKEIANQLENLNFDRQKITQDLLEISKKNIDLENNLLFVLGKDWHEGVIGLVAGKLQEEFHKPVLVATNNEGVIKGSARSISGFDITKTLTKFSKYLHRFGGHELAAGFTVKEEKVEEFKEKIIEYANKKIKKEQLVPKLYIDLLLESDDVSYSLVDKLNTLEPFGYGNTKPVIALSHLIVVKKNIMGKESNHMKLLVKGNGIDLLTLIMFGCNEDTENLKENDEIDVVGYPDINIWNGRQSIQFSVKEWRYSKN